MVISGGRRGKVSDWDKIHKEGFWGCCNVLVFNAGGGYTGAGFNYSLDFMYFPVHFSIKMYKKTRLFDSQKCIKPQQIWKYTENPLARIL